MFDSPSIIKKHRINQRIIANLEKIERRAFESQFAGDLWYGDGDAWTFHPNIEGRRKVYLVTVMMMLHVSFVIAHFCSDETAASIEFV